MKRIVLLSAFFLTLILRSIAQEKPAEYIAKPRLSVGAEFAVPSDKGFGNLFTIGYGGSAKFEVPVTRKFYGTLTAGFTKFVLKDEFEPMTFNKTYVPLKAGGKYYIQHMVFAEGELGASVGTNKGAGTAFAWAAGAGVSLPITKDGYLDTGVRYEKWARDGGNIGQAGFRIAYKF